MSFTKDFFIKMHEGTNHEFFIKNYGQEIYDLIDIKITGKAKRNIYSFDLSIEVNGLILRVDRGDIVALNEEVRYMKEFNLNFIITESPKLKIFNINEKNIYTYFNEISFRAVNIKLLQNPALLNIIGTEIQGKAENNIESLYLTIKINKNFAIKVNKGGIILLNEDVRYMKKFYLGFMIQKDCTMKILNINGKKIDFKITELYFDVVEVE